MWIHRRVDKDGPVPKQRPDLGQCRRADVDIKCPTGVPSEVESDER